MERKSLSKERMIGEGGTGVVDAVWHPTFGGPVALKYLSEAARVGTERERNITRFKNEVRLLRDRLDHPNVIRILHAELDGDDPWFLMPLAPHSLADAVPMGGLPEDRIRSVFGQILAAVDHAHDRAVLHRDLMPHNVLMFGDQAVVADFGLGRDLEGGTTRITTTTYFGGTVGYTAPEQMTDFSTSDRRADIYGLGSLLYFLLTGRSPQFFDARLFPARFYRVVSRCREIEPSERYQTVADLHADFNGLWQEHEGDTPRVRRAEDLMENAASSDDARRQLIALYLRFKDDLELYRSTLPEWSDDLIAAQTAANSRELGEIVSAFCDQLPGRLRFEFLDTAAGFLRRVFRSADDPELRELILRRLLQMAVNNNRYYVGGVFVGLLRGLQSAHDRMLARDLISADPGAVQWLVGNAPGAMNVPIIAELLQSLEL